MRFLADTNFLSELLKPRPDAGVMRWLSEIDENEIGLSVITIGEIARGISRLRPGARRDRLQQWLDEWVLPRFADRILPLTLDETLEWGRRYGAFEREGNPRPVMDSLLAVTALNNNLAVITRDERGFDYWGVEVVNPWDEQDSGVP